MRRLPSALVVVAVVLAVASPANAHRLKLFATVEDGTITGYGFFIGGGRPQGATLVVRDAAGAELYRGKTDDQGGFSWRPSQPSDFTVLVDTRDGHVAEAKVPADRFAGATAQAPPAVGSIAAAVAVPEGAASCAGVGASTLAELVDQTVDRAVSRQVRPLLEAYEAADGRVRLNDVVGGAGMIIGLAGIAMWALGRRPRRRSQP